MVDRLAQVVVASVAAAVARLADYQAAPAVLLVAVPHVAPAASVPDPVLCEPAAVAAVAELADYPVAQVVDTVVPVVAVAVAVAPLRVRPAAAVVLVASDAQLAPHEPGAQRAAADAAVAQQRDLEVVPPVEVVPRPEVVPQLVAVPLFALPAEAGRRDPDPDARLASGISVP